MYWDWFYYFGYAEGLWIFGGLLAYSLYLWRVWLLASQLKNHHRWAFVKLPIRALYFGLFLVALLGPTFGTSKRYVQAVGKDIYVLLDLSRSMSVRDVSPSRFEKARFELKNLLQSLKADRLGVISFAEEAFLECPLTYDKSALDLFLQSLTPGARGSGGTAFAPALNLALAHLQSAEEKTENYKSKLVILVSDGEDFGEDYYSVAYQFRERGIPIYALGIGTEEGDKVPYKNNFMYNNVGKPVISRLNAQNLQSIASMTTGYYFSITKVNNEMPQLIQKVKEVQGQKIDQKAINVADNKYVYFLWVALGMMLIDLMFKVKVLKI